MLILWAISLTLEWKRTLSIQPLGKCYTELVEVLRVNRQPSVLSLEVISRLNPVYAPKKVAPNQAESRCLNTYSLPAKYRRNNHQNPHNHSE